MVAQRLLMNDGSQEKEFPLIELMVVVGSFGPNQVGQNLYDSDDVILKFPSE